MRDVSFPDFQALDSPERRALLAWYGALRVAELPVENACLLALSSSFGNIFPSSESEGDRANQEEGGIYLIKPLECPLKDPFGNPVLSTSREYFPLHTDQFFKSNPADIVAMLCSDSDGKGGDTLVSDVSTIVEAMPPELVEALSKPFVRAPFGFTAILRASDTNGWRVAYNRYEIEKFCHSLQHTYTPSERELFDSFELFAARHSHRFSLRAGDCLLLDNRRVLHGRTEIAPESNRLVKRVRVRIGE